MKRPGIDFCMIEKASEIVGSKIGINPKYIFHVYSHPMDGYELAKILNESAAVDITRDQMEELDEVESIVSDLLNDSINEWFKLNDIQPPLPIGAMTTQGEITGIYEYSVGRYEIKQPGQDDSKQVSRLLVNFEDVTGV